jgi:hypothetical protein
MGRRSPTPEPSAVLGTIKAAFGGGQEASLDGACARRS